VDKILSSIAGNFASIHGFSVSDNDDQWKTYNPNLPSWVINDLSEISEDDGYWIYMDQESDYEFLSFMNEKYPDVPVIVMTAFGSKEIEARINLLENCQYCDKSVNFNDLIAKCFKHLNSSFGGRIHGISLASFLQMSEMEQTTCKLKITSEDKTGYLYLTDGQLIDAETGSLHAETAAYEIVSWDNTQIEVERRQIKRQKTIQQSLMNILMQANKIKDEQEAEPALEKASSADSPFANAVYLTKLYAVSAAASNIIFELISFLLTSVSFMYPEPVFESFKLIIVEL